ncbi:general stress protein [Paenibacillus gansuensis]|uniref:General stress protein n=1 Tax=Paenibacillus gansuensis TaxID=306542 RepID=A0ABW5PFH3_9BACL
MKNARVGVFKNEADAILAIDLLKERGIEMERVSVISLDKETRSVIEEQTEAGHVDGGTGGRVTGGLLGGYAGLFVSVSSLAVPGIGPLLIGGALAATLTGATIGAIAGGSAGSLADLGLTEDQAKHYNMELKEGHILVLVETLPGEEAGVLDVLNPAEQHNK